jgi:hypothetical protein
MPASLSSAYQEIATPMVDIRACSDTGLSAEAARILQHPTVMSWAPVTRTVMAEVAAGHWPIPPLLTRRLVVRAARSLERRP